MVITTYVTEINFAESSLLQKIIPSGKYTFNWRSKRFTFNSEFLLGL